MAFRKVARVNYQKVARIARNAARRAKNSTSMLSPLTRTVKRYAVPIVVLLVAYMFRDKITSQFKKMSAKDEKMAGE